MNTIVIILIAVMLSAFFSGMEIAFVTSNKLRIELDRKQGVFGSDIISTFIHKPGQYIATMLIGNNVSLVIYGLLVTKLLQPVMTAFFDSELVILLVQTIASTAVILFVAEFLPKTVFLISPNFFLKALSIPTMVFYIIFYPVSKFTLAASNLMIRVFFGLKKETRKQEDVVFSKVDLDHFVNLSKQSEEEGEKDHHNIKIFQNALDFSNVKLRECMVPRTEIIAINVKSSIEELKEKFIETRFSKILVYKDSIDNIIGYFELKDIFKSPPEISTLIRKLAIVPESMPANRLLKIFVEEKKSLALVVDEFGGTSGMVTIEDVLEEIVGDIEDEHDVVEFTEKVVSDKEFILSGRLEVDYLNEKYDLKLPEEDDYETLAGLVLYYHGSIPRQNDTIRIRNFVIKVLRATSTKLELINLKVE
jgi:CBS domain containing-hemolysin-like protein